MNGVKEEFLSWYGREVLDSVVLPEAIARAYDVEACLKHSRDKSTYLLRSKSDGALFVLKQASRFSKESLRNEYDLLSLLDHSAFPKAIACMEEGESAYLLREYVQGRTLGSEVERRGALSDQDAAKAAIAICRGLSWLHRQDPPVIHRDIKPENIVLTPDGGYALIDMGTARTYKSGAGQDTVFMGTQATASPEQYGFGQTDARSDVYAMGVLLIFMLTGDFDKSEGALRAITEPMRRIISKCISLDPKKRYASAEVLEKKLEHFLHRRARSMALGIAAGVCAAALCAAFFAAQSSAAKAAALGVQFSSPLIEKAVRLELGKDEEEPILRGELALVQQVLICGDTAIDSLVRYRQYCGEYYVDGAPIASRGDIVSLEDLKKLPNLTTLVLDRQNIEDISALSGLPIRTLGLCGNRISDLSALEGCTGLQSLRIEHNPLEDAQSLASLKDLEVLDISFTQIDDISPIAGLPIRELYLIETPVGDYAPLGELAVLEKFAARYLTAEGVDVVGTLTSLKDLTVYQSGVRSLDPLLALTSLENLDLNSNGLSDLSNIDRFPQLRNIGLGTNPIESLAPLAGLPMLTSVDITNSDIRDLSPLIDLPRLQELYCDKRQAGMLKTLIEDPHFNINIQE